jgi:AraC-like DNA-binding protein
MPTSQSISWLFDTENPSTEWSGSIRRVSFPYPSELAIGHAEHIEFQEGITLVKNFHKFDNEDRPTEIPLGSFVVEPSVPSFVSHMVHSGCINIVNDKNNHLLKRVVGIDILGRAASIKATQTLVTEEDISSSMLIIPENQLFNLLGSEIAEALFTNLGLLKVTDYKEIAVPQTISNKIANCTPSHLTGNMRHLYAQSMIFQYLIELNIFVTSSKESINLLGKNDFNVDALHADLLQITADIPKLTDLAKKYNVTPSKLNQIFADKYNQSIYSFLSNQRLEQAHQALCKTNIPMKTLAHRIGYSHVNHFITAFKKKYGVTPGSIRQ